MPKILLPFGLQQSPEDCIWVVCVEIIGSNVVWYYLVTDWEPEDIRRVTEVPVVPVGRRSLFFRIVFYLPIFISSQNLKR